jgi:hypothetical protein
MIPAILYDFIFFPLLYCFLEATWYGPQRGSTYNVGQVLSYYFGILRTQIFIGNQMWFTVTLFAFSLGLTGSLAVIKSWKETVFAERTIASISQTSMVLLLFKMSLLLIIMNCLLRIAMPDGYIWVPVIANIGFIMQYCVAFAAGILANSYQFLDHISKAHLPATLGCSCFFFWLFQLLQTFLYEILRKTIGFYAHVCLITIFEQLFAVFWSYSLLVLFKEYQNAKPSKVFSKIIGAAYATYIVHQWVIIPLAVGFAYTNIHPMAVSVILAIVSPFLSWGLGLLLKAIPGANNIL